MILKYGWMCYSKEKSVGSKEDFNTKLSCISLNWNKKKYSLNDLDHLKYKSTRAQNSEIISCVFAEQGPWI